MSYNWSNGGNTPSIMVSPTTNTTYTVTITDTNGCNATASFAVVVNPLPNIAIAGSDVCPGATATLTASGGATYVWSTNETTSSIAVTPATATTYTVTGTNNNGCVNTAQFTVNILPIPTVSIVGTDTICAGLPTTLTASGGTSYVWSNNSTTAAITVSPSVTTTYTVTVTGANGCTNTSNIEVFVNPNPEPIITGDLMICVGDTATLSVSPGVSFEWSTGETTSTIDVTPIVNTVYSVTVTDVNGCVGSTSTTVFVDQGDLVCQTQDITIYLPASGMVTIDVQDISTGSLGACADVTASLSRTFFACNDISSSPITVTLTVTNNNTNQTLTCTADVTILDTLPPTIVCPSNLIIDCEVFDPNAPLSSYGSVIFSDNCPAGLNVVEVPVIDLNVCNDGLITRTFTVTDASGNSSQCVQSITIVNPMPFSQVAITWPADVTVSNCDDVSVDDLGDVVINDALYDCAELTITNLDNLPSGTLCGGVFARTFTVVDACTNQTFTHTQNITVNVQIPVISGSTDTICINKEPDLCIAEFSGSSAYTASGCNLTLSGTITLPDGMVENLTNFDFDGEYPDGITNIRLIATESCNGFADTLNLVIEVKTVISAIQCVKTRIEITDLLTVEESVYAHTNITQGCDVSGTIIASYTNTNAYDTIAVYDCDDAGMSIGLTLYFWIEGASAPFTICQSLVHVDDTGGFCPILRPVVKGNVHTESMTFVPNVDVDLNGSGLSPIKTDISGNYSFPEMDGGGEYMVKPKKDDYPLDGVSTLDLIFIQKHILGDRILNSPYKIIAADVNKDNRLTSSDLVELRKLILGHYDRFQSNTSWRMVDEAYVFPDPKNPLVSPFAEEYHIENLNSSMNINWIGVKVGDVNDSYLPGVDDLKTVSRSRSLYFSIPSTELTSGINRLPVRASDFTKMNGFQISMPISGAKDVKLVSELLDISNEHFSYDNGILNISWSEKEYLTVSADDILFYIDVNMAHMDRVEDVLLTYETVGLKPEWYSDALEAQSLGWRIEKSADSAFTLYGNVPNPWKNETSINFHLPESGDVSLRVRDITGRVLYHTNSYFNLGDNSIRISNEAINYNGVLIYDLTFKNEVRTQKMLNIK